MHKKIALFILMMSLFSQASLAQDQGAEMRFFLKSSGYGTLFGALAGVVSLVFEDKMGDHSINIARGASLGLYTGMAYGYIHRDQSQMIQNEISWIQLVPIKNQNQFGIGLLLTGTF